MHATGVAGQESDNDNKQSVRYLLRLVNENVCLFELSTLYLRELIISHTSIELNEEEDQ